MIYYNKFQVVMANIKMMIKIVLIKKVRVGVKKLSSMNLQVSEKTKYVSHGSFKKATKTRNNIPDSLIRNTAVYKTEFKLLLSVSAAILIEFSYFLDYLVLIRKYPGGSDE